MKQSEYSILINKKSPKSNYTHKGYEQLKKTLDEEAAKNQLKEMRMSIQRMISCQDLVLGTYLYNHANGLSDEVQKHKLMLKAAMEHKSFYAINYLMTATFEMINGLHATRDRKTYSEIKSFINELMNITKQHHGTPGFILSAHASIWLAQLVNKTKDIKGIEYTQEFMNAYESAVLSVCVARKLESCSKEAIDYAYTGKGLAKSNRFNCKSTADMVYFIYGRYSQIGGQAKALELNYFEQAASKITKDLPYGLASKPSESNDCTLNEESKLSL